jgi:putative ABC transport system permease protein
MRNIAQDVRYAARVFLNSPGFTAVALLTLALGVGANTTIFGLIYTVLLRDLPYPAADRIVTLVESDRHTDRRSNIAFGTFADWLEQADAFDSMAAVRGWSPLWSEGRDPELLRGLRVSHQFFRTLGVSPPLGRDFLVEEDRPNGGRVVILSHAFWRGRLGGDKKAIGETIRLGDLPYMIIGILPPDFRLLLPGRSGQDPDVWSPLAYDRSLPSGCRTCGHLQGLARLAPGVTLKRAREQMDSIQSRLIRDYPNDYPADAETLVTPFKTALTGRVQNAFYVLLGAVALILLIACANIANLLMARGIQRRHELAVRAALGAGRGRIIRQLVTESIVLGVAGGFAGLILAIGSTHLIAKFGPKDIPRLSEATVSWPSILFAGGITVLAAVVCGLAPAWHTLTGGLQMALTEGSRGSEGRSGQKLRNLLVTGELALALVLLVGSGLLLRSLTRLLDVDPGFDSHSVLTMGITTVGEKYAKPPAVVEFYRQVVDSIQKLPGVDSAAVADPLPISGGYDRRGFHIKDRPLPNVSEAPDADRYVASPGYFATLRIPILRGRDFNDHDTLGSPPVALISETTAREQWPGEDPIGKQIQLGGRFEADPWISIIGIVGDVRHYTLDTPPSMQAYVAHAQQADSGMGLVVRSTLAPRTLSANVRQAIASVDSGQPVFGEMRLDKMVAASLAQRRFTLGLLGGFTALALLLAVVGVYGVMSYSVQSRAREFGIRLAIGADHRKLLRLVLSGSLKLIAVGLGTGLLGAIAVSRLLTSLLFQVTPSDPFAILGSVLMLAVAAALASYIPARRAARTDPIVALRCD